MNQADAGPGATRRLAAILVADVVGYSRLMRADDEGTLNRLQSHRAELIDPAIALHHGRLVKTMGDGLLVEFPSIVDALRCAIQWQDGMRRCNAGIAEDMRIVFRIGINLGDVIVEDEDIHGDGVNVAARLEGLAKPGTICISRAARDQVRDRFPFKFDNLGELRVKNIARPVQAFLLTPDSSTGSAQGGRWRSPIVAAALALVLGGAGLLAWLTPWAPSSPLESTRTASPGTKPLPLPDKPSVVVLPFADLGGDSESLNLGDGLADNIISSLSKLPQIFVIARSSAFTYKDKSVKVQTVAEDLGVRYVLEGSVQHSGTTVRITAQLIDATTGFRLWSETYDRQLTDLFALQDEITLNVITAFQVELTHGELARVRQRGTKNLRAWLLINQSFDEFNRFNRQGNAQARRLIEEALALDPDYPDAYVRLARTYLLEFQTGWESNREQLLKRSVELTQQALKLDPLYPDAYVLLGAIFLFLGQHDTALQVTRKAIDLSPNHSLARASLGMILTYAGEPGAAVISLNEAMRLSPLYPDWFLGELGRAYFQTGQYGEAIEALSERLNQNPDSSEALVLLAAAESAAGRPDRAAAALAKFLEPRPGYTLKHYAAGEYYKKSDDLARILEALRKAGLPE